MGYPLKIEIDDEVFRNLVERFQFDKEKWSELVSRFLEKHSADFTNWDGLPHCWNCGESIGETACFPGNELPDGSWEHVDCNGVWDEPERPCGMPKGYDDTPPDFDYSPTIDKHDRQLEDFVPDDEEED
jgi:hypothetical protein